MAVGQAFSPKEWEVWIVSDATDAGTSGLHASSMHQLDVDSVGMPSLNLNQSFDVRSTDTGGSRTFVSKDVFQDNVLRVTELSISGVMHVDTGHGLLVQNICNHTASGDISVISGHLGSEQIYGDPVENAVSSLTVVLKPSDLSSQKAIEMPGMLVTNFSLSADTGTEGGRYKFSATLQSGVKPDVNESSVAAGTNVYANTTIPLISNASSVQISNAYIIMQSFTATIDHPAVFTGASSTGFHSANRGPECAVTVDAQVKYDSDSKGFINEFDAQTAVNTDSDMFVMVNDNDYGIDVLNGFFTNVALSEGDIMMLDCSIKAVDDGTNPLITFDLA